MESEAHRAETIGFWKKQRFEPGQGFAVRLPSFLTLTGTHHHVCVWHRERGIHEISQWLSLFGWMKKYLGEIPHLLFGK